MARALPAAGHSYVLLDGLRGVAAIAVAIRHMPRVFADFSVPNSHLAVDFFLQLSGFIVAYAYAPKILSGMSLRDFTWRRVNRLYPAYLLGFGLGVVVAVVSALAGNGSLAAQWTSGALACTWLPNAVMLPAACDPSGYLFPLNLPMWSVFYELVINLAFFFAVALVIAWWRSALVAAGTVVILVLLTFPSGLDVGTGWDTFPAALARLVFSFAVGVGIYSLRLRPRGGSTLVSVGLFVVLAAILLSPVHTYLYEVVAVTVVFPAIVVVGSLYNPAGRSARWTFSQLGALSYVLYVVHRPLYELGYAAVMKLAPSLVPRLGVAAGIGFVAVITVVAWLLARFYEPPARRLMDRLRPRTDPDVVRPVADR
jgi:peptidoglycan/LPS O-acetylase OafA/YrhL